ncbi:MAG: glycosyltransferase family 4 protein [Candidatus Omnitrophica bacterium]|nr:glycosyltransferase family 4 protein [Candidatus Omnitrophota bacterium]MDD5353549.1 glycosyltransferase family 4 protein [Candidatus Omnitrophota bacterium]MDD5592532.1 glycosyltransferase family 4 protein [Candidatus Omnitrophota bacterium]
MKKILLISFEYPIGKSYCGGVGQIVEQSRDALLALGYETYVLISSGFARKDPVKLLFSDNSIKNYPNLGAFLRDYDWCNFGYIIHHFVNWTKELKKLTVQKRRKPKIIYHFHSILRREKESGFRTLNHFLYNQEKMIELADRIICPSTYEYDNFIRYFPSFIDKVVVIENTVETFGIDKKRMEEIRDRHKIKKNDIVSLYVGRLERIKGAHILLKEAPMILRKHRHLKLFFVGRSLEKDLYERLLRLCGRFPGQFFYKKYLDKSELFQYYYLSDIYINSSLSESFSLSTHESALCNNALLLNRLPVLEKFKDAALFFDVNSGDFSGKYDLLIRNRALRKRLSGKAIAIADKFINNNRFKDNLYKLLNGFVFEGKI